MILPPSPLVTLFEPWASYYSDSHLAQTLVTFAHIGGLVVGGGTAITADRGTLRMASDVDRRRHLLEIGRSHRLVVASLVVVVISGLLLFASDLETYWGSPIFWMKMALVAVLLVNGARMQRVERKATLESVVSSAQWAAMRGTARASLILWLAITLAGVALITYA
jgi:uncharacterized membrane protein